MFKLKLLVQTILYSLIQQDEAVHVIVMYLCLNYRQNNDLGYQ